VMTETPDQSKIFEDALLAYKPIEGTIPDDDLDETALSDADKSWYRWVRGILSTKMVDYYLYQSGKLGVMNRRPPYNAKLTKDLLDTIK